MPRYLVAGVTLDSEISLPELRETTGLPDGWGFTISSHAFDAPSAIAHEVGSDEQVWLRILRDDSGFVLRFAEADFAVNPGDRSIACHSELDPRASTLRHLLLDQVIPYVLSLDGSPVLHASAVAVGGAALVFAGPSGRGKSSLAAEFARAGYPVLADDFVVLRPALVGYAALPAYPGVRLWPDSAGVFAEADAELGPVFEGRDKRRLEGPDVAPDPRPMKAIVFPVAGEGAQGGVDVRRISPRDGFIRLFSDSFRMELHGAASAAEDLDRFTRLASAVPLFEARYPRDYDALPQVREAILRALAS